MSLPVIKFDLSTRIKSKLSLAVFIGFITFVAALFLDEKRAWASFLTSSLFVLFLSLGALFFVATQHVSKAGWSANIRRIMEGMSAYVPLGCLAAVALIFAGDALYVAFDKEAMMADSILIKKIAYLNPWFFSIRLIIFSAIWFAFYKLFTKLSLKQDETGDKEITNKNTRLSVIFLIAFALSFTFFTVDTLMTLEAHWFSTVFGVYSFAGLLQSFFAALILFILYFKHKGLLDDKYVNANHLHDLGKFLLGATLFWAYIAFSQYMLVWYANLPEEATYYLHRSQHAWAWVSIFLIVFKFIVPFVYLFPRWVKRDVPSMIVVSVLVLITQYVDIYWMVYPNYDPEHIRFGWIELGMLIGFIGLFLYPILRFFSQHPMIALCDPREHESSQHHVTY